MKYNYLYLGIKIKAQLRPGRGGVEQGHSLQRAFLLASKICQRNQQPFPFCLCHFFAKECVCDMKH